MCKEQKTVSVETMRKSDAYTIEHFVSSKELMRRAGQAIYDSVIELSPNKWQAPVAIACGKGNNAGDGYVVANLLHSAGIDCTIVLLDSERFSEDGKYYYDICVKKGIPIKAFEEGFSLATFNTILDAILGTGFNGNVQGKTADMINAINARGEQGAYIISADINSGLNGDTGLCGDGSSSDNSIYVKSDLTVSIGTFKHGHFLGLYETAMKEKVNCDIGIQIIE